MKEKPWYIKTIEHYHINHLIRIHNNGNQQSAKENRRQPSSSAERKASGVKAGMAISNVNNLIIIEAEIASWSEKARQLKAPSSK